MKRVGKIFEKSSYGLIRKITPIPRHLPVVEQPVDPDAGFSALLPNFSTVTACCRCFSAYVWSRRSLPSANTPRSGCCWRRQASRLRAGNNSKKKRNTCNALAFESDYERRCVELWREINAGTYRPSRSIAFIINKPVKREIFAADFRDRVVHHLIARRLARLYTDPRRRVRQHDKLLFGNDAAFFLLQPAVQGHEPYR